MVECGRGTETQELLPIPFSITLLCLHCPVPWEATCASCPMAAPLTSLIIPSVGGIIDWMVRAEEDEGSLPFNLGVCFSDDYISLPSGWLWHGPWDSSASYLDSVLSFFVLRVCLGIYCYLLFLWSLYTSSTSPFIKNKQKT